MPSWNPWPPLHVRNGYRPIAQAGHVGSSNKMYEIHVVRKLNLTLWGYISIPKLKVHLLFEDTGVLSFRASPSHICPPVTPGAQAKAQQWSYTSSYEALTDTCLQDRQICKWKMTNSVTCCSTWKPVDPSVQTQVPWSGIKTKFAYFFSALLGPLAAARLALYRRNMIWAWTLPHGSSQFWMSSSAWSSIHPA